MTLNYKSKKTPNKIYPYPWILSSIIMSLYVWSLPILSYLFDQNKNKYLCNTLVICSDNTSFYNKTGSLYGCGCGQGIFGQSVCPVCDYGYTISSYIATAPATGLMACVSAFPSAAIWLFGTGSNKLYYECRKTIPIFLILLAKSTIISFQVCFFIFLFATDCIFPHLHDISVSLFCLFGIIHYCLIAYIYQHYYDDKRGSKYIINLCLISMFSFCLFILTGHIYDTQQIYLFKYFPWAFECLGITTSFSIAPIMIWYEYIH